jgi:hypothetical protein
MKHTEHDKFGQRHLFWEHLRLFRSEEKVADWEKGLFPEGIDETGTERVYNLITLSVDAHRVWDRGAFALQPISASDDTLKVRFFWQKRQQDTQEPMSLLTTPISTEGLDHNEGDDGVPTRLYYGGTGRLIKSGDYIELRTDDPINKPLPSLKLLEMQWFLQRVAGMAGAVGNPFPSYSECDSDEWCDGVELDVEDVWDKNEDKDIPDLTLDSSSASIPQPITPEIRRNDKQPDLSEDYTDEADRSGEEARYRNGGEQDYVVSRRYLEDVYS